MAICVCFLCLFVCLFIVLCFEGKLFTAQDKWVNPALHKRNHLCEEISHILTGFVLCYFTDPVFEFRSKNANDDAVSVIEPLHVTAVSFKSNSQTVRLSTSIQGV